MQLVNNVRLRNDKRMSITRRKVYVQDISPLYMSSWSRSILCRHINTRDLGWGTARESEYGLPGKRW
jgi:hypothetical protein